MGSSFGRRVLDRLQRGVAPREPEPDAPPDAAPDAPPEGPPPPPPLDGYVDAAFRLGDGVVVVIGWANDVDAPATFDVAVGERPGEARAVRGPRADVDRALGGEAALRGFVVVATFDRSLDLDAPLRVALGSGERRLERELPLSDGSVDTVLRTADEYGERRPAVLALLRDAGLGQLLLGAERPQSLDALGSPVRGLVDAALVIPERGVLVAGWLVDPEGSITAIHVRSDHLVSDSLFGAGAFRERPDIAATFADVPAAATTGFVAFVPLRLGALERSVDVLVSTAGGAVAALPHRPRDGASEEHPLDRILDEVAPGSPGALSRLGEHVVPAVRAWLDWHHAAPVTLEPRAARGVEGPVTFSVIVPVVRRGAVLLQLGALEEAAPRGEAELLYVCSDPESASEIERVIERHAADDGPRVRVLATSRPAHPAEALRLGIAEARGEYVACLGPSVVPARGGWLSRFRALYDRLDAGVLGGAVLRRDGTLESAGVFFEPLDGRWPSHRPGRGEPYAALAEPLVREVPAVDGACLFAGRDLALRAGDLDAGHDDPLRGGELCLAASELGAPTFVDESETFVDLDPARDTTPAHLERALLLEAVHDALRHERFQATIEGRHQALGSGRGVAATAPADGAGRLRLEDRWSFRGTHRVPGEKRGPERAHVVRLSPTEIAGWVRLVGGEERVALEIFVDDAWAAEVVAEAPHPELAGCVTFEAWIGDDARGRRSVAAEVRRTGSPDVLARATWYDEALGVELLQQVAHALRSGNLELRGLGGPAIWRDLVPDLVARLRAQGLAGRSRADGGAEPLARTGVTVVVPVYDGLEETRRCLESLAASRSRNLTAFDVLVVNDASPSAELSAWLHEYAEAHGAELVVNPQNLGFVRSVNAALRRVAGRDVVLLNADTVVAGNWVDRLRAAAYSEPAVASVTPLSNDATICSYPEPDGGPLPADTTPHAMDELCAAVNAGQRVPIPSGVGFCLYVRGAALREVGLLDELRWGRGYGEENDWCVKAADRGWVHLAATDVFVQHTGGVSFGSATKARSVARHLRLLGELYPEYHGTIQAFLRRDPLRLARNRIALERIKRRFEHRSPRLLFVTHGLGGGVDAHVDDLIDRLDREGVAVARLAGAGARLVELTLGGDRATYRLPEDLDGLSADLGRLGLHAVHVHSDVGSVGEVWAAIDRLGLEVHQTLHDYAAVCPRVNLTLPDGRYCGEPMSPERCDGCVAEHGAHHTLTRRYAELGRSTAAWRAHHAARLEGAERVFAPDEDVRTRFHHYLPNLDVHVRPHPADPAEVVPVAASEAGALVRVAVIGAIGPHKGVDILRACAEEARAAGRRLHFTVVGHTSEDAALSKLGNVAITGAYALKTLPSLLGSEPFAVALFLSRWPETFSYTLSEAVRAGIPPLAFDIGAPGRRVRALGFGDLMPLDATASDVNERILALAGAPRPRHLTLSEGAYQSLTRDYYGFLVGTP